MENSTDKEADKSSEVIQDIHKRIKRIKSSEKVGVRYMQAWEEKVLEREAGRLEGMEAGRLEGMGVGIEAFILDNLEEGVSKDRILEKLEKRFGLSADEANSHLKGIVAE